MDACGQQATRKGGTEGVGQARGLRRTDDRKAPARGRRAPRTARGEGGSRRTVKQGAGGSTASADRRRRLVPKSQREVNLLSNRREEVVAATSRMKLRVVCRKVHDYVRYKLKEITFPSSLPDLPHIKKRPKGRSF